MNTTKKYEYHVYRISVTFQGKEAVDKGIEIGLKLQKIFGNTSKGGKIVLEKWFEDTVDKGIGKLVQEK